MKDNLPKVRSPDQKLIEVRNIYCVGRIFFYAEELNNPIPEKPLIFQKSNSALTTFSVIKIPTNTDIQNEL